MLEKSGGSWEGGGVKRRMKARDFRFRNKSKKRKNRKDYLVRKWYRSFAFASIFRPCFYSQIRSFERLLGHQLRFPQNSRNPCLHPMFVHLLASFFHLPFNPHVVRCFSLHHFFFFFICSTTRTFSLIINFSGLM